jgi:UDPglucose 6-dehydrogenase
MSKIAIIGAGVVGQATGKGFINSGHSVIFVDVNAGVINFLRAQNLEASLISDIAKLNYEIAIICLPTPSKYNTVDLSYIEKVLPFLCAKLLDSKTYQLFVFRSTIPPGTTESIISVLENMSGRKAGKDFGVCFNPEFLREASSEDDFLHPWSIVIGSLDAKSKDMLMMIYDEIIKNNPVKVLVTDLKTAEMIKYAHNLYNATKISFTNEIWTVCQKLNINSDIVMESVARSAEGMWNPRYGIKGGYAFGGNCLPKDTECFLTYARNELGLEMPILESIIKTNNSFTKINAPDFILPLDTNIQ